MKVKLLCILVVAVISLSGVFFLRPKTVELRDIYSFYYFFTTGNQMNASVSYSLRKEDGKYIAAIKPKGVPTEEAKTYEVTETFVKELEKFLWENQVEKWNGFDRSAKIVRDGNQFSLDIYMENGDEFSAHGYMKWPKNYQIVSEGIIALFDQLKDSH